MDLFGLTKVFNIAQVTGKTSNFSSLFTVKVLRNLYLDLLLEARTG